MRSASCSDPSLGLLGAPARKCQRVCRLFLAVAQAERVGFRAASNETLDIWEFYVMVFLESISRLVQE